MVGIVGVRKQSTKATSATPKKSADTDIVRTSAEKYRKKTLEAIGTAIANVLWTDWYRVLEADKENRENGEASF